jgi:hypothetical protein
VNIVGDFSKECLAIDVDTLLPGRRVVSVLERLAECRGLPYSATVANGPEFAGKALDESAYSKGLQLGSRSIATANDLHFLVVLLETYLGKDSFLSLIRFGPKDLINLTCSSRFSSMR